MLIWFKMDYFKEIPFLHFILADWFKVTFIQIWDKKSRSKLCYTFISSKIWTTDEEKLI